MSGEKKTLKDFENYEKTRQNAENKQTFDLTEKNEIEGKTCQNAENKQTFHLTGKNEINDTAHFFLDSEKLVKGCVMFFQNIAKVPNVNKIETLSKGDSRTEIPAV